MTSTTDAARRYAVAATPPPISTNTTDVALMVADKLYLGMRNMAVLSTPAMLPTVDNAKTSPDVPPAPSTDLTLSRTA